MVSDLAEENRKKIKALELIVFKDKKDNEHKIAKEWFKTGALAFTSHIVDEKNMNDLFEGLWKQKQKNKAKE